MSSTTTPHAYCIRTFYVSFHLPTFSLELPRLTVFCICYCLLYLYISFVCSRSSPFMRLCFLEPNWQDRGGDEGLSALLRVSLTTLLMSSHPHSDADVTFPLANKPYPRPAHPDAPTHPPPRACYRVHTRFLLVPALYRNISREVIESAILAMGER